MYQTPPAPLHQQLKGCHRGRFRPDTEPGKIRLLDIRVQSGQRFEHGPHYSWPSEDIYST